MFSPAQHALRLALVGTCLALVLVSGCRVSSDGDAYTEAMSEEHRHDTAAASPAVAHVDTALTRGEEVTYATLDGQPVRGFLARPANAAPDAELPGLVVIHEWWGLNDNIRAMTRKLAEQGYVALAIDLYGGRVATVPDSATAYMQATMQRQDALMGTVRQAVAYLDAQAGADGDDIGVIGWCMGGAWALETALALGDDIDAAVMYYGRVVTDPARLRALDAPLLGLFGEADEGIPIADVRAMERELRALGKDVEVVTYPGADHAFANPTGDRYNADAADAAWAQTTAFLARHLQD